jgi:hypothetical protein
MGSKLRGATVALLVAVICAVGGGARAQTAAGGPVGLIKEASAGLPVHAFQQVMMGQTIPLGPGGHLKISYYQSCVVETIDGGTVTIGSFGSRVVGGRIASAQDTKGCRTVQVATTAATSESGAAIERVMAFDPRDWTEATVSTTRPIFQPVMGLAAPVHLRILMLDDPQPKLVWEGVLKSLPAPYPSGAPKLFVGLPYAVELTGADGVPHSTTFSIDPGYRTNDGAAVTVVAVSP